MLSDPKFYWKNVLIKKQNKGIHFYSAQSPNVLQTNFAQVLIIYILYVWPFSHQKSKVKG